jgi:hypothetical protein
MTDIDKLNMAIMNIPYTGISEAWTKDETLTYKLGHRDARHAAVDIVLEHFKDVQQAAPEAPAGEVKLGPYGKLIDWSSNGPDLFDLPVGTKLYFAPTAQQAGAAELVHQMRHKAGGTWTDCDADGETCIKRMPHWADAYEFRTLQVISPAASTASASRELIEAADKQPFGTVDPRAACRAGLRAALANSGASHASNAGEDTERDAARYRWLRTQPFDTWKRIAWNTWNDDPEVFPIRDEEIDAAIAASAKEKK